ncbi:hypothetical protein Droror1_Dr00020860 [Drosera rotundifolia]
MPSCSNQPASFYVSGAEAVLMKLDGMHSDEANRVMIKHEVLDESVDQNHSPTSVFGGNGSGIPMIRDVGSFRAANGTDRNPPMNAFNNEVTPSFAGLKRMTTNEGNAFSFSNKFQYQNENFGYPVHGLVHHLSLPRGSIPIAATMGTVPLLQHSVPVRIRAKRGCATHPRSIAERMGG